MHSKQTVKYICERYPSGNCYYFKQEMITSNSWQDVTSLQWGMKRPITKITYDKRKKEGYRTEESFIERQPAVVLPFNRVNT
ncbi:hypothetical protein [Evansella cellulosilytica]|uniref:Uncharacterized protein n=1 Tax=Evansella cellulosilytica (strain ATCC 21833 / DSM 2522 / FERM P-1141 / JCM 9156 / N-4) TaxID=649639 RepID=E6TXU6_EVAC2|nr:hypothetical protein [Evansella cellulosilytica]ADU30022.1 hypothetical protein Bcell_1759 [Evansella cellulosilytica DSM 2522]